MKNSVALAAALLFVAAPAFAQTNSPAPSAVANPSDTNKTSAAPVAGKNSFTLSEAKKRLEDHGYTQVAGLMKDSQSIWHAKAMKDGQPVSVAVDFQGNISQP